MRKILSIFGLFFVLIFAVSMVSYAQTYNIDVAFAFDEGHSFQDGLEYFRQNIAEETDGRVKVNIHSGGVLGGELETLQMVISGNLDAAVLGGVMLFQGRDPRASIEDVPFLFPDLKTARTAYDGKFGEILKKDVLEPQGIKVLNYWENGFRHFTNNIRPIYKPEDMEGILFRTAESQIRIDMFEELGAKAVPMAFPEVFSALQRGTIDGQENPLPTIYSSSFQEVQKYLSLSSHIYSAGVFIISPDLWEEFSPELKKTVQIVADEARDHQRKVQGESSEKLKSELEESMEINQIDYDAFKEEVSPVWELYKEEYNGAELLEAAQEATK